MFKLLILSFLLLINSSFAQDQNKIVFLGDSLTIGYGLDKKYSFPDLIQEKIKNDEKNYKVINAGISGSTTASGMSRLKWFLKQKPSIIVIALGSNDALRGAKVKDIKSNLQKIIKTAIDNDIKVLLCGARISPNYGDEYRLAFDKIFPELAEEFQIAFVPFLLRDVAGERKLNQADGIHPNIEGQKILAENVYTVLKGIL